METKCLILAGTHHRENPFTYRVADQLIARYGIKKPDYVILGKDGARRGKLWLYDEIAVGKIEVIGECLAIYLERLDHFKRLALAISHIENLGLSYPPCIEEHFDNNGQQWTSVTEQMIKDANADITVDLHGFHEYSQKDGNGLWIIPNAIPYNVEKFRKTLERARREHPDIYGGEDNGLDKQIYALRTGLDDEKIEKLSMESKSLFSGIEKKIAEMDEQEVIAVLRREYPDSIKEAVSRLTEVNRELFSYEEEGTRRLAEIWNNGWSFVQRSKVTLDHDVFTFEAVHWQQRQQDAIVNFISRFLAKSKQ